MTLNILRAQYARHLTQRVRETVRDWTPLPVTDEEESEEPEWMHRPCDLKPLPWGSA